MKTEVMVHCGNSPKMQRVIDLTVALAGKDVESVESYVREDFVWKTVGEEDDISYEALKQKLTDRPTVTELNVDNALSHGNGAMCEGTLSFENGDTLYFCNVVTFVNTAKDALIKETHTYYVD